MKITRLPLAVVMTCIGLAGPGRPQVNGSDKGSPRVIRLTIQSAEAGDPNLRLLPPNATRKNADGAVFYDKAVAELPGGLDWTRIRDACRMPLSEFPLEEARVVLQGASAAIEATTQGTTCKTCTWQPFRPGQLPPHLDEYRCLTFLLSLKARAELAQRQPAQAVATVRTALATARHVGDSPTITQALVGIAMAEWTLSGVEDLVQMPDSPNLRDALRAMPQPFIDINKPIAAELDLLDSNPRYWLVRRSMKAQLAPAHARVRMQMARLDRHIAALACIEAIRHYMATHDGRLPTDLSDITESPGRQPSAAQASLVYRLDGEQAILQVPAPAGGGPRDAIHYILIRPQQPQSVPAPR